jgi:RNA polymerase sigma-70 factor (ECF subfamily)
MNRAIAIAEWKGVDAALGLLDGIEPPAWLARSYLWDAVLADLYRRAGQVEAFERHRERAISAAPGDAVRELLRRRMSA